ncbi:RNA-dependent DNA polymerase, partial [Escherichia coli]|nr:RNA-dependent DNA polymerase [Escherichia coli]
LNEENVREENIKRYNKKSYYENIYKFREFQKNNKTLCNKNKFGIPQGSAISAVFANIYASEFDLKLKEIADEF